MISLLLEISLQMNQRSDLLIFHIVCICVCMCVCMHMFIAYVCMCVCIVCVCIVCGCICIVCLCMSVYSVWLYVHVFVHSVSVCADHVYRAPVLTSDIFLNHELDYIQSSKSLPLNLEFITLLFWFPICASHSTGISTGPFHICRCLGCNLQSHVVASTLPSEPFSHFFCPSSSSSLFLCP